ncbi:MAG: HD domain-containing protein [Lachnospiraceae bacterium]|nr:HD domain-containing protein [Lachnospiraceae bacterium]
MEPNTKTNRWYIIRPALFYVFMVLVNIFFNRLVGKLGLPLFVDNVGTMSAAILGGYLPGVVVGYVTNIVNMTADTTNAYYAVISALIAVAATYMSQKGMFEKFGKTLLTVPVFALLGGGLGSILTFLFYGYGMGEGISAPFAKELLAKGSLSVFQAQLISDVSIDIIDKLITVVIVFFFLKLIPAKIKDELKVTGWRQEPLSKDVMDAAIHNDTRSVSLRAKIVLIISVVMIFVAVVTTSISYILYRTFAIKEYTNVGISVAKLAASTVDGDMVEEYLEKGEAAEGYIETEERLEKIRETNPDIEYIYVYMVQQDGCHVVFDLDTPEMKAENPGDIVKLEDFDEILRINVPKMLAGEEVEPMITVDKYGHLLTDFEPIMDSAGKTVCYAGADIQMEDVLINGISFLSRVAAMFLGFFILILVLCVWLADYHLIYPIAAMTHSARKFAYDSEEALDVSVERLNNLHVRTGDEIENLYESLSKTIAETVGYIEDVKEKGEEIAHMQNGLIYVLADLVESRDKNTGDHVRKTAAYVRLILEKMQEKGIYTEYLTDEYIEDVCNSAPLHDVGKIKVSDLILNKPGRLDDNEFEIMKSHTTAGNDIIASAMALVSDSGYLKEAKNLATYHHEKWDGSGYPSGKSGEDIPLSARIMAIADVFDALVSKRSYKKPFTIEEALGIIKDGAGKHFDPKLAELFIEAEDEVRRIAEEHEKNSNYK